MSEAFTVVVGVSVFLGFDELDQTGRSMVIPVAGTTAWSNLTPATGTVTPSPTGQSATYTPIAPGVDVVTFTLTVTMADGSVGTFSDTATLTVQAAPQVLTSVTITEIPALV